MEGIRVPVGGGRAVLVRSGYEGECVQLAIVSTRGNIIEAVTLDRDQLPALVAVLQQVAGEAEVDLLDALTRRQEEAEERYRAALARNPWLNGKNRQVVTERYRVKSR